MLFARIARPSRPIESSEWETLISTQPMPAREGINSFTNEKVLFPGRGRALYIHNGQPTGNAGLEAGEIFTTGVPADICQQLAAALKAQVFEDHRS